MSTYSINRFDGSTIALSEEVVSNFPKSLHGELLTPNSKQYDEVRAVWNGMINRHPGLIVRCNGASDVIQAVNFAQRS